MNISLLAAMGGAARHRLGGVVSEPVNRLFPRGTFRVNVSGRRLSGFLATFTSPGSRHLASNEARIFLLTGICGGDTTFAALGLRTVNLRRGGDWPRAGAYVPGSVVVGPPGTRLGHLLALPFSQPR